MFYRRERKERKVFDHSLDVGRWMLEFTSSFSLQPSNVPHFFFGVPRDCARINLATAACARITSGLRCNASS